MGLKEELRNEVTALKASMMRQDARHITFESSRTIIHGLEKDTIYIPNATGKLFHDDNSFIKLIMGPYGSGKSTVCGNEIVRRACLMPRWYNGRRRAKCIIIRNTSGELSSTTLQTWLTWFGELGDIRKRQKPLLTYEHYFNDGLGIVELELVFIALDRDEDIRKLKSIEATFAYINEISEVPQSVLHHLIGRVNHRYPSAAFCSEPYWSGVIADTNPPDEDHWIYKDFELNPTPNYKIFHQPSGLLMANDGTFLKDKDGNYLANKEADNYEHLSSDYYPKLAEKRTEGFIKVYCAGKYGLVESGKRVFPEYNDDLHSLPHLEAIQGQPIHLGWDFGLCYSEDTEVLTDGGFKLFRDVREKEDLIATRNPETGELEYTPINFKVEYDYDGELLEWASTEVNFCVTPEHRVPFTYRDTPHKVHFQSAQWLAEHMTGHHYIDLCSKWNPQFDEDSTFYGMKMLPFAQFMGLYLSEGSCELNRISIYQNNQNPVMQEILDSTERKWKFNGNSWRCGDPHLAEYLKTFGNAYQKYVPKLIKSMPPDLIKAFIYAYTMGDGHIRKRANGAIEHTLFTVSKIMANDMQELAQKAGWNSSLRKVKPQISTIIENGIEREISNNGGYCITFKKQAKRAELLKKNFKRIAYKGKIYCLNVPYHTLYIRRNGKPSWNGNTPACVVVQRSPRGQIRILKEYQAEDMGIRSFAKNVVLPDLKISFPYCKVGISIGDPAGAAGDTIMEELSCIGELNALGIKTEPASTNDIDVRLGSTRYFLNTMVDGQPCLILDRELAPGCRKGFINGYHFKRMSVSGDERYQDKPNKNKWSHRMDALGYILSEFAKKPDDDKPKVQLDNPVMRIWN